MTVTYEQPEIIRTPTIPTPVIYEQPEIIRTPTIPTPVIYEPLACPQCGIRFSGVSGYVCCNPQCPIQPRVVAA